MAELENFEFHDIKNGKFYCQEIVVKKIGASKLAQYLSSNQNKHPQMFSNLNLALNFKAITFENDELCRKTLNEYYDMLTNLGHKVVGTLGVKHAISKEFKIQPLIEHEDKPSILSGNPNKEKTVVETVVAPSPTIEPPQSEILGTKVIKGIVRGGTVVRADNENVLIIGSVRHGAEIIAGGSVVVYGSLEGRVVAGLKDNSSYVLAQNFQPDLVAINGVYITNDQVTKKKLSGTVLLTLDPSGENLEIVGDY